MAVIASPGNPRYLPMAQAVYDGIAPSFIDTGLINGQLYYYTLYAYDRSSNYSRPVTLTIKPIKGEPTVGQPLAPAERQALILQLKRRLLALLQKLLALLLGRQIQ